MFKKPLKTGIMDKFKEKIKENKELGHDEPLQTNPDGLKEEINKLLWKWLPSNVTIGEADTLAMVITDSIFNIKDYIK